MSYCINFHCQNPQNLDRATVCKSCGSNLLLKGRYRVFHTLGQNLAGRTFLAVDEDQPSAPRCVIQQFYQPEIIADGQKQQFRKFSASASALDKLGKHPQIPKLLASFELDGYQYLVQEYIDGRNLATQLSEKGVCNEIHIWYLLNELLPVLQFVHDNQLIHQDIKPSNIIHRKSSALAGKEHLHPWDDQSGLVLVDFAAAIPTNSGPLKTDTVTGSAEYAAPEQIKGEAIPSSDIYSLGVTCIHLLTGMSPFDLFDLKADAWAWRDYLKVPVSTRLGRILDQMVQRETSKRYRTISTILKDIKHGPAPLDIVLGKPQWTLGVWTGAVVALISLVLGSRFQSPQLQAFTYQEPAAIPEIKFNPPPMQNFRGQELIEPTTVRTLATLDRNPVWAVAVTPNGAIVSGNNDGTIQLRNKDSGKVLKTLRGHSAPVWAVAVSPDRTTIISGSADNTIKLWNIYTGELIRSWDGHTNGVFSVAFSADGRTIASVGKDKTLKLWQVDGVELETFKGLADEVESVVFSPNEATLATGNSDGTVKLWDWQTGELKQTLTSHSEEVTSLAISPDGKTLASGSWDKTVHLWDISANHESQQPRESQLPTFESGFVYVESPDFNLEIKANNESRQPNSSLLRTLIDHSDPIQSLAFSPDGNKLASSDLSGTIKLWQTTTGENTGTLKEHSTLVKLAFNPQDQTLVSGSFDDTIKVWQVSP